MFNANDFSELKKALEQATLEVADLKVKVSQKERENEQLRLTISQYEQQLRSTNVQELQQKIVDLDITNRELQIEKGRAEAKVTQFRVEIQSLNDRMAGLKKENENLKRESIARQAITNSLGKVKDLFKREKEGD